MSFESAGQTWAFLFLTLVPSLILAIAFLQSGWDKIVQRKGNLTWFESHFAKTILGRRPDMALTFLTILEILAGFSFPAFWMAYFIFPSAVFFVLSIWVILNGLTLVSLFFGQRLAGDYAGASNINGYVMVYLAAGVMQYTLVAP
jgi:hypothetical protein